MIGAIVGAGLSAVGSIYGGIKASQAAKAARENVQNQLRENQNWYDRRYNEDATQRADAQRILQLTQENIRNRNRAAQGTAAVMGGTEESVAATKQANAQAMADAAAQIAAQGEARKDSIEAQYNATKTGLNNQLANIEQQRAQEITKAIGGVANAAGSFGSALDDAVGGGSGQRFENGQWASQKHGTQTSPAIPDYLKEL